MIGRREVLRVLATAGATGLVGVSPRSAGAEPPPETTRLRLGHGRSTCQAPLYLAEELLPGEGFEDVQYVKKEETTRFAARMEALASGETNIDMTFSGPLITHMDTGSPITVLAGGHVGCFELFGTERVRAIRDLKGKTVAVRELGDPQHVFLASMLAYVGLNPRTDVRWATHPPAEAMRLLAEGKINAYLAFPPIPQELRAKKIGRVVVNSMTDRPWSHYYCCMVAGHRQFVQRHPVATKRAVRAILKAADICAREPERVARFLVEKGYTPNYDYALQGLRDLAYGQWREYDPEDTLRFYGLRLHEAGFVKSSPQRLIAQGTDWRFLNELRKELKG